MPDIIKWPHITYIYICIVFYGVQNIFIYVIVSSENSKTEYISIVLKKTLKLRESMWFAQGHTNKS